MQTERDAIPGVRRGRERAFYCLLFLGLLCWMLLLDDIWMPLYKIGSRILCWRRHRVSLPDIERAG